MTTFEAGSFITPTIRLVRPLGEGGMGSVWIADHLALHTQVVVKFMSTELASSPEAVDRFRREAASAAQVKSAHVVQMHDHGLVGNVPYIVMEHLEGQDFREFLEQNPRPQLEVLRTILAQACKALSVAHTRGIVHRDIKPDNIFLMNDGTGEIFVKILDFGIAKSSEAQSLGSGTRSGAVIGTPYYMSPEQLVASKNVDARSDLWSLGIVMFVALTGRLPYEAESLGALAVDIHTGPSPIPSRFNPYVSPSLDAWFARACAKSPADRFASAKEMSDAFQAALSGGAPRGLAADSGLHAAASGSFAPANTIPTLAPSSSTVGLGQPSAKKSNTALFIGLAAIGVVVVLFVAVGAFALRMRSNAATRPPASDAPSVGVPPLPPRVAREEPKEEPKEEPAVSAPLADPPRPSELPKPAVRPAAAPTTKSSGGPFTRPPATPAAPTTRKPIDPLQDQR